MVLLSQGKVDLIDNGSGGTVKYTIVTPAIGSGEDEYLQVNFPDVTGLRFETDLFVFFNASYVCWCSLWLEKEISNHQKQRSISAPLNKGRE